MCYPTAIADALFPWQIQPAYTNLDAKAVANPNDISTAGKWLTAMRQWIPDITSNGAFKAGGINTYLNYTGLGPSAPIGNAALNSTSYFVTGGVVEQITAGGAVETIKIEIFPVNPLADTNFSFNESGWTETPSYLDPFGCTRTGGGEDILDTSGSLLED